MPDTMANLKATLEAIEEGEVRRIREALYLSWHDWVWLWRENVYDRADHRNDGALDLVLDELRLLNGRWR